MTNSRCGNSTSLETVSPRSVLVTGTSKTTGWALLVNLNVEQPNFRIDRNPRSCKLVVQKLRISGVRSLYQCDLAYVHATAFEDLARGAADQIVGRLRASKPKFER